MERFLSRALISMAAAVAAIIFVSTAAIFLCAALYLWLISLSAAPALAALLAGLSALVVAALIMLAAHMASRYGQTGRTSGNPGAAASDVGGNVNDLAAKLGSLAARELTSQAQAHPYRAVAVSLLAGLAVGISPELRNLLTKTLKD